MTKELLERFKKMSAERNPDLELNDRVLIIDGLNTFIRSFCAIPTMNDDGEHIGGATGFLMSIGYVIRNMHPTRVYVVFDGKGGSQRRRKLFPEYKAGRKTPTRMNRSYDMTTEEQEKELMKKQLMTIGLALQNLPVTTITVDGVEADDVMSYISELVVADGGKAILYSTDKDFLQMVSEDITVWNPIKKRLYEPSEVLEDYGVHPHNFLLYRALTGDDSDNIPGIRGLGKKTMLKHFPEFAEPAPIDLDMIFKRAEGSRYKIMQKIVENREVIELNMQLMSLDTQQMSGTSKSLVRKKIDNPKTDLDKRGLTTVLKENNVIQGIRNYNSWVASSFNTLTRFDG